MEVCLIDCCGALTGESRCAILSGAIWSYCSSKELMAMRINRTSSRARSLMAGVAALLLFTLLAYGYGRQVPGTSAAGSGLSVAGCSGSITPSLTEGPYWKAGSPERTSLLEPSMSGTKLVITGYVYDKNCQPVSHAWLDFWQADASGAYDNAGYK